MMRGGGVNGLSGAGSVPGVGIVRGSFSRLAGTETNYLYPFRSPFG